MEKMKEWNRKLRQKTLHRWQEHKRRQAERQNPQQGEQQQGESSSQPPPGFASSSQQATTPARPPSQSGSVSSLTPSRFSKEFREQNEGFRNSLEADRERSTPPGYMLHGTSASNAADILETGLQTSHGGKEGGASSKMEDPKKIKNSQNVVHGTPSRGIAKGYASYHDKLTAGAKDMEKNSDVIGFRNVHPESTERDPDSQASYTISQSISPKQVVRVPNEKVDDWPTYPG